MGFIVSRGYRRFIGGWLVAIFSILLSHSGILVGVFPWGEEVDFFERLDIEYWARLHDGLHPPSVSHPRVAAFPRWDVHCDGPLGCVSSPPWHGTTWH